MVADNGDIGGGGGDDDCTAAVSVQHSEHHCDQHFPHIRHQNPHCDHCDHHCDIN